MNCIAKKRIARRMIGRFKPIDVLIWSSDVANSIQGFLIATRRTSECDVDCQIGGIRINSMPNLFKNLTSEGDKEPIHMKAGDHLTISAHQKHRVEWTMPDAPTIWLAVSYSEIVGKWPSKRD